MRIYILDDEPPAIDTIVALLELESDQYEFTILGHSTDPEEGIDQIKLLRPDVLFLDVEMPGVSGLEVVQQIKPITPIIVFATAFRNYAIDAFGVDALHYLVKPISPDAFSNCLAKVYTHFKKNQIAPADLQKLIPSPEQEQIAIKGKEGYQVFHTKTIVYVQAEGAYVRFFLDQGKTHLYSKNLSHTEQMLTQKHFIRISRSVIINVNKVVSFTLNDGGVINLTDDHSVLVGRTYYSSVKLYFKNHFIK